MLHQLLGVSSSDVPKHTWQKSDGLPAGGKPPTDMVRWSIITIAERIAVC